MQEKVIEATIAICSIARASSLMLSDFSLSASDTFGSTGYAAVQDSSYFNDVS